MFQSYDYSFVEPEEKEALLTLDMYLDAVIDQLAGSGRVTVAVPPGGHPGGTAFLTKFLEIVQKHLIFEVFKLN